MGTFGFHDRDDAAGQLADALRAYRGSRPLVLAIPRGAVPMGERIARALDGDLDVVLVRKLGAPGNPELAVGAVDESGWTYLSDLARDHGFNEARVAAEKAAQMALLRRRRALYTPGRGAVDPQGRTCIVVDDGLATGATMVAALHGVRSRRPARLVAAAPVASPEALALIRGLADDTVVLLHPAEFMAVSLYYREFPQVSDDEAAAILARWAPRPWGPPNEA